MIQQNRLKREKSLLTFPEWEMFLKTSRKIDIMSKPFAVSRLSLAAISRTLKSSNVRFNNPTSSTSRPIRLWSLIMTVATRPARTSSSRASSPGLLNSVPLTPSSTKWRILKKPFLFAYVSRISFWWTMELESPSKSSSLLNRSYKAVILLSSVCLICCILPTPLL